MNRLPPPDRILITGASGGLGRALATHYAAPGRALWLHGRDRSRLADLAKTCQAAGARVELLHHDLAHGDLDAWRTTLAALPPMDLVVVNAGITSSIGPQGEAEPWSRIAELLDINLYAALATVDAALPAMRERGRGQIALISSLAAWYGMPVTPAYCASKAGLKAYGEALRGWLAADGVAVSVVLPGFVASDMSARFPAPKPFLWPAEKAARTIARGLARDRARIAFPLPLSIGMWGLSVLPAGLSQRILGWLGYGRR